MSIANRSSTCQTTFFFFRSFWVFKSFCIWFVHFTIFNFVPLKWRREWSEWTFCSLDCHSTYVRLQFFVFFFSNILSSGYLFDFVAAPEMGAAACTKRFRFITFRQSTEREEQLRNHNKSGVQLIKKRQCYSLGGRDS